MLKYALIFSLFFFCVDFQGLSAKSQPYGTGGSDEPWFTGPLFTPSARVIRAGHVNIEPYLFWTTTTGRYENDWSVGRSKTVTQWNPLVSIKIGLSEVMDFSCDLQANYTSTQGRTSGGFGDFPVGVEYQLYRNDKDPYLPIFKIAITENLPTGKYQKLSPHKMRTDSTGNGAFTTILGFTTSKLTRFSKHNFLNVRFNIAMLVPSTVSVKGVNAYGGDPTTKGRVFPGNSLHFFWGAEYSLTQNWALALDIIAKLHARTRFKGRTKEAVGGKSSERLSAAPAIEYNWNSSMGLIAGAWFSFAGRNSARFSGASAAFNYYY